MKIMLEEGAIMPQRAHEDDAGLDMFCREDATIEPGERYAFDTGVHISVPKGYCAQFDSKSGLWRKHGIMCVGTIDTGYTGPLVATVANLSNKAYHFNKGDKITQLVLKKIDQPQLELVNSIEELDIGERGNSGFGSTGR